jgi:dTDP-4-dehydrorhamnose reductase
MMRTVSPHGVIHTAALTNPNACETAPSVSRRINVDAAVHLAACCGERGIPFLFTSTDLVFDGETAPCREADLPSPICVYGRQKAEAEAGIRAHHPSAAICRMPLMFGMEPAGAGFFRTTVAALISGDPLHLFTDEMRTPLSGREAAGLLLNVLDRNRSGTFHLGGPRSLSRYDLGLLTAEALGVDPVSIIPCRQADRPMAAPRPRDVSLDSRRTYAELGLSPSSLETQIRQMLQPAGDGAL